MLKAVTKILVVSLLFCISGIKAQEITNNKLTFDVNKELNSLSKRLEKLDDSKVFTSDIIKVPVEKIEPFLAVGFRAMFAEDSPQIGIYLRASSDGSDWTEWYHSDEDDLGVMGTKNFHGEMVFFNDNTKYIQYKIKLFELADGTYSQMKSLEFSFISPGATPQEAIHENIAKSRVLRKTNGNVPRPNYVSRKAWGCPQPEHVSSRSLTDVTHLIVHHSASKTTSNDFAAVVRSYWSLHVNTNGWDDIGYNWLVDGNGVLYKGRAWKTATQENVRGAHNSGKNSNTAGICLIGNYDVYQPKEEGLNMLYKILAFLSDKYSIDPVGTSFHAAIGKVNDNIDGHGQSGGGTACPGRNLSNKLNDIRVNTQAQMIDITQSPVVTSIFPSTEIDSINSTMSLKFEFTHPMAPQTVESAFSIEPEIEGSFSWNTDYTVITFTPNDKFINGTSYIAKIAASAMSKWIKPLVVDYIVEFAVKKKDRLSLIATNPADGEQDVTSDVQIDLKFDAPLKSTSLGGNVFFVDAEGNAVSLKIDQSTYSEGRISFSAYDPLEEGKSYAIILKEGITDVYGYTFGDSVKIEFTTKSTTDVDDDKILITNYYLEQNYPNPFNPSTVISYNIPRSQKVNSTNVKLTIYDILGNKIDVLVDENQSAGKYKVNWNADNHATGIYFYQLQTPSFIKSRKMILQK